MTYDLTVLGAGISGLSLAYSAARTGLSVILVEKKPSLGGSIQTASEDDGFWIELGAHTLYNSYGSLLRLMEEADLMPHILRRDKAPYRLLVDGHIRTIPSQLSLSELLTSAWRAFTTRKEGQSVGEYYGSIVGQSNWQQVFSPLLSAVPSQRADDFPAEMLFKRRPRRKSVPRSFTLQGGLSTLVKGLAQVPSLTVRTGVEATGLYRDQGQIRIRTDANETIVSKYVALALPASESARLLTTLAPAAAALIAQVRIANIHSTGVVIAKNSRSIPKVAGIIPQQDDFFSIVSRDVLPHPKYRGMTFHFRAGLSPTQRLERIQTLLGVRREQILSVKEHATSLPSPTVGHAALVEGIEPLLKHSGIYLTGNYFGGLAIEDCVLRSIREFERLLSECK